MMTRFGVLVPVLALSFGCGDDDAVPLSEAPAEVSRSVCEPLEACLGPLADLFLAGQDCSETFEPVLANANAPLWEDSIEAGRLAYDGSRLRACADATRALGCDALIARDIPACEEAFEGLVEPGGACVQEADCAGEAYCASAACPGVCTLRKGGGEPCAADEECRSGFGCNGGTCTTPAAAGESCGGESAIECEAGLLCAGETDTEPGTCSPLAEVLTEPAGASCGLIDGLGPLCQEGLSCVVDSFDFATMEVITLCATASSSGGACKVGFPEVCPAGEFCNADPAGGMFEGECQPLPLAGEPCRNVADDALGAQCAPGHACAGSECVALQANGATCSADAGCYSGNCSGTTCAPPTCI